MTDIAPEETESLVEQIKKRQVSALVANNPESPIIPEARAAVEAEVKAELLKDVSLDEVRELIQFIRSGGLKKATMGPGEYPDEFDAKGRNFRRMVHKWQVTGASGVTREVERPFAMTLADARKQNPPIDYFDQDGDTWILYGYKRAKDYPENQVGFEGTPGR